MEAGSSTVVMDNYPNVAEIIQSIQLLREEV